MSGDRSRERRQRACECFAMAKRASDANSRAFLVETAWKWLDLAERDGWDNWQKALRLRAIQTKIGQELRSQYELPQALLPFNRPIANVEVSLMPDSAPA
jgi:hypothetical protein